MGPPYGVSVLLITLSTRCPQGFAEPMSKEQVDALVRAVESLLAGAAQLQARCREESVHASAMAAQLREESERLRAQSETVQLDMEDIQKRLEELLDTKAAFEARERQARKLSKQL
ncbi:peripherin-like [Scleropages formosus]|uniref:Peripherin-like n=1 Tax=Scleropages formosus TaxID=113540 RepID=A0A0P7WCW7_SCLFO|nr:peripherin-like [Scleropages formosus]